MVNFYKLIINKLRKKEQKIANKNNLDYYFVNNKMLYYAIVIFLCCSMLSSCGCGFTFLYNWRPKPWVHPYVTNINTRLDTLLNINGFYLSQFTDTSQFEIVITRYSSIMFYNNGLCVSLNNTVSISEDEHISTLDTLYSNQVFKNKNRNYFYKVYGTSWGTYEVKNDTIKVFLIENLTGCDGTRKNIISITYLISNDKQLKQIFIANSNKEYGYKKILNIPYSTFYPIENKRDSTECPYLTKKWFCKKDKVK